MRHRPVGPSRPCFTIVLKYFRFELSGRSASSPKTYVVLFPFVPGAVRFTPPFGLSPSRSGASFCVGRLFSHFLSFPHAVVIVLVLPARWFIFFVLHTALRQRYPLGFN